MKSTPLKFKHTSSNFFNRELSWLEFNRRVMSLALEENTPILERLKFCEIYTSNLDEFFMKRVGGLKNQVESKHKFISVDGQHPTEQLEKIKEVVYKSNLAMADIFNNKILPELKNNGIHLLKWDDLNPAERKHFSQYFDKNIFPILTPLGIDHGHPFPFISNLSKSLGISLVKKKKSRKGPANSFVRIKIPSNIPVWVSVTSKNKDTEKFINVDEIIINNIHRMFPDMKIVDTVIFRVTRNSDWEKDDEDTEDLMEHIEETIKERQFAPVVRLEYTAQKSEWILKFLSEQLEISEDDMYPMPSIVHLSKFTTILKLDRPELKYSKFSPPAPESFSSSKKNLFNSIRKADRLFHHPYESFTDTVEKFIRTAANDPKVVAIKLALYRTDSQSKIIDALIHAAKKGKQVACVIELKARFDEQNNILMAQKLEKVGIYVVYGMKDLKTHSKMALVVRQEKLGVKSYVHIGTGNYNSETSLFYSDISFFTVNKKITSEVIEVFNALTGIHTNKKIKHLLLAPINMRKDFLKMIKREIAHQTAGLPAKIIAKMNSLEDIEIIVHLYKASQAGVSITLIVRGFCCLKPGIKGLSENIKVISIVGRFLEHSRIYFFQNGKMNPEEGDYFIGSADWMYRNLNNRFEVVTPIDSLKLKKKLYHILKVNTDDLSTSWELKKNGKYIRKKSRLGAVNILLTATHIRFMMEIKQQ
ncbi:MAG: polyphosphate kinase 1 [Bacteriovorax sp.]|nr:polyphosphate kinase 1 [Bacteriovorax sp.]